MTDTNSKMPGYVYILGVADIALPVCKVGMTSRTPGERCDEINKSSTGDFLWEVAYSVSVNDCKRLESVFHEKLEPLRQKRREFFNLSPDAAFDALRSILGGQSEIQEISIPEPVVATVDETMALRPKANRAPRFRKIDTQYSLVMSTFATVLGIKGRPFGQLSKPCFGMSDGNEGVQWNIAVYPEKNFVRVAVNLEGMQYVGWPIATFILRELAKPTLTDLKRKLNDPARVFVSFRRDAWQVQSRPAILDEYFGGSEMPLSEIDGKRWELMLKEALACLDESRAYRGRAKQSVTLAEQPKNGLKTRTMWVSPHLTLWTEVQLTGDVEANISSALSMLKPVHAWVSSVGEASRALG